MAITMAQLPGFLRGLDREQQRAATVITREVIREVSATAAAATPVDTGLHRSNWVVTVGSPFSGQIPPYAPGKTLGINERSNLNAAVAQHHAATAAFEADERRQAYLTNNGPAIQGLDAGTVSRQGSNMVAKALQMVRVTARRFNGRVLFGNRVRVR